jgi:preprotein translocase subunit Sec61beta
MSKHNDTISPPSGSGGLVNFREEYPSKLQIKPEWVMYMIIFVVIAMGALKVVMK